MRRFVSVALLAASVTLAPHSAAQADRPEATPETLISRPELRPATVTALKDFNFGGGDSIAKGTELSVADIERDGVVLDNGEFIFKAAFDDTDILERTASLIEGLSDEALALTFASLKGRPELWPTRVALRGAMEFSDGSRINAGEEVALRTWQGGSLEVARLGGSLLFQLEPEATDLLARARALADAGETRPFFARSVEHALDPDAALPEPVLAGTDYLLIYIGSGDCSRCARFTPELKKAYRELKARHDNFEVVYLSGDRSKAAYERSVAQNELPWRVVPYETMYAAATARSFQSDLMPVVYLVRPDGTVIASTASDEARDVVKRLERELKG